MSKTLSKNIILVIVIVSVTFGRCLASVGDRSTYYQKCSHNCFRSNCTIDISVFRPEAEIRQPYVNKLLYWDCKDECKYECTWKTVERFTANNWLIPQFHGKWPFIRVLGIQELGSVIGSLLNLLVNLYIFLQMFKEFSFSDTPLLWLWYSFFLVSINAWIWSTIFHTRDFYFTEFMDYACAFSLVLMVFFCFGMRVLYTKKGIYGIIFSGICVSFYMNHIAYLYTGKIDYAFNMLANIVAGAAGGSGWLLWSLLQWRRGSVYVLPCGIFVFLSMILLSLELLDFPPFLGVWDAHAIWHVTTAPLPWIFYKFIEKDLQKLRKNYTLRRHNIIGKND